MWGLRRIPILRTFGAGGKPWARSDKIAAVLGGCSLVLAAGGVVQTQVNNTERPHLEIAMVSVRLSEEIDAVDENMQGTVLDSDTLMTPKVDVTVRNSGDAESLITRADLTFRLATRLARCVEVGGEVAVAADYDVKVPAPWGDPLKPYSLAVPFTVTREMRFQVEPHAHDRFTLTVGPKRIPELSMPWIYDIDISLRHDDGAVLRVGAVVMLSAGGQDGITDPDEGTPLVPRDAAELRCQRANFELVDKAVRRPGEKSAGLLSYRESFRDYLAELPG
jgi:hypothetical protein